MATQTNHAYKKPQREVKFRLGKFFVDADVVIEPEEPKKIVVAGMTEARVKKEYPDGYIKKSFAVFKGEFTTMLRTTAWFMISTLLFILVIAVVAGRFEDYILGGNFNFMSSIGVGYPGGGDSIAHSVSRLYWDVYEPVLLMLAATMIFSSMFASGLFYAAKRAFHQDYYKMYIRTYFIGFAKYWWKYLITGTVAVLLMAAMGTSVLNLLSAQQIGAAEAWHYCVVVFTFIIGAPLLTVPMVMMGLFPAYKLSFKDTFKNAIVIIANNPISVVLMTVISVVPILVCIGGMIISIIAYIVMVAAGFSLLALLWIAVGDRGMNKCKILKAEDDKKMLIVQRRSQKESGQYQGNRAQKKPAKKTANAKPYQNPKKKKKK